VVSVIEPLTVVAEEGSNVALNVILPPVGIVVDVLRPVSPKPAPATLICENISVVPPPLLRRIVCEFVFPSVTVPKPALDGAAAIAPVLTIRSPSAPASPFRFRCCSSRSALR